MLQKLSIRVTDLLERNSLIDHENREIYEYGMERMMSYSMNIATTCIIGVICGLLPESLIFSIAFICLRHNNGGAHASNNLRCYVLSTLSILGCLFVAQYAGESGLPRYLLFATILPFAIAILLLTPVEDYNKPIDDLERRVYRERGIIVLTACVIATIVFMTFDLLLFGCVVGSAIIMTSISMMIGAVKNHILDRRQENTG